MCHVDCANCDADPTERGAGDPGTDDGLLADGGVAEADASEPATGGASTHTVEIEIDGDVTAVECGADQPILEAAEDAGLELPHSCRGGSCTECVARLEAGDVDQSRAMGIDPMQKDDGYLLPCVATPNEDCRIVADVQDELFDLDI